MMPGDWDSAGFRHAYVADGGSPRSAQSYTSYLNRADRVLDGLASALERLGGDGLVDAAVKLPAAA